MGNCLKSMSSDDISLLRDNQGTRDSSADQLGPPPPYQAVDIVPADDILPFPDIVPAAGNLSVPGDGVHAGVLPVAEREPSSMPADRGRAGGDCAADGAHPAPAHGPLRWQQEEPRVRDLHGGVCDGRRGAVPALHAHLPHGLHRRLAHALLHLPLVHGARGRRPVDHLPDQLRGGSPRGPRHGPSFADASPSPWSALMWKTPGGWPARLNCVPVCVCEGTNFCFSTEEKFVVPGLAEAKVKFPASGPSTFSSPRPW